MTGIEGNGTETGKPKAAVAALRASGLAACLLAITLPAMAQEQPAPQQQTAADPQAELSRRRDQTRGELDALSKSITLSNERAAALEQGIAEIEKTNETLRAAVVECVDKARPEVAAARKCRADGDAQGLAGRDLNQFIAKCKSCGTSYVFESRQQYEQFKANPGCCPSPAWQVV